MNRVGKGMFLITVIIIFALLIQNYVDVKQDEEHYKY